MPGTLDRKEKTIQQINYKAILEAESEMRAIRKEIDHVWATHPNKLEAIDILYDIWVPKLEQATANANKLIEKRNASASK